MTVRSSRPSSAVLRARSAPSRSGARTDCPRSPSRAVRRRRPPVPDDLLPDLPAPDRRPGAHRGAGGVERWTRLATDDESLAGSLARATEEQRRLRHELAGDRRGDDDGASLDLGIGGSRSPGSLKCLHAHAAFALARPGYALGERILEEVEQPWPPDRCCSKHLLRSD